MHAPTIDVLRLLAAGLVAGLWSFVSGILMAAAFGYREMSAAFATIGLRIPKGMRPFVTHTLVRLGFGMAVVCLLVVASRVFPPWQAVLFASGLAWLLGSVFPYVVVTDWGVLPWRLAWKVLGWSALEFFIAAWIGQLVYRA